jgi:hypothetical protein
MATIQPASMMKSHVHTQNRFPMAGWRRTHVTAVVTLAAWMTTQSAIRPQASRSFDSMRRSTLHLAFEDGDEDVDRY